MGRGPARPDRCEPEGRRHQRHGSDPQVDLHQDEHRGERPRQRRNTDRQAARSCSGDQAENLANQACEGQTPPTAGRVRAGTAAQPLLTQTFRGQTLRTTTDQRRAEQQREKQQQSAIEVESQKLGEQQ